MAIDVYGIPNCDTVKKARRWLDANGVEYTFHDYKKIGADPEKVSRWIAAHGVDVIVNKRGTTFRKLTDEQKAQADDDQSAVDLLVQHPSMIKRPVVEYGAQSLVGFKEDTWSASLFSA
ncbi:MAG: ArsC family reductase [Erythrobacter sp.]